MSCQNQFPSCYLHGGKHLQACCIQASPPPPTARQAIEQHCLYFKGNWPVISNQDLTLSLPIKMGTLQVFSPTGGFITAEHNQTRWLVDYGIYIQSAGCAFRCLLLCLPIRVKLEIVNSIKTRGACFCRKPF